MHNQNISAIPIYFVKTKTRKKYNLIGKILPVTPQYNTMDHPKFNVSNQKEEPISA